VVTSSTTRVDRCVALVKDDMTKQQEQQTTTNNNNNNNE